LAAVAQITSRAAARDEDAGTGPGGLPSHVRPSVAVEVALDLTMPQYGASAWTHLAVKLTWRPPGTGAALADETIDLPRARPSGPPGQRRPKVPSGHSPQDPSLCGCGSYLVEYRSARRRSPPRSSSKYLHSMASKNTLTFCRSNEK
jgi:hypothetical protein